MYPSYQMQYPTMQTGFNPGLQGFQAAQPTMPTVQPVPQRPIIFGRPVNGIGEVTANDVPMDGTSGVFPLRDESAIYVKKWNPNGTISTIKYVPENDISEEPQLSEIESLKNWLDNKFEAVIRATSRKDNRPNNREEAKG